MRPEEVRVGCAWVAERARLVRIDEQRLVELAAELTPQARRPREPQPFEYAVTFNAVNFGSGWHPHLTKLAGCSGNVTIQRRLRARFDADGPFSAAELAALTAADCASLLAQPLQPPV